MWSRGVTTGVSLRGRGPIDALTVPSGTTVEEHDVVTDGDVLVGGQSTVELGIRGRNIALGERVRVAADIEAEGDCRIDTWGTVDGTVLVGEDAYLGERVTITGRLLVSGDLDIGDDVTIEEGFEANGWIVIRNPIPTIVFYFIVLSQLLRAGETDAADELAAALADGDDVRDPLVVPRGAEVSDDAWRVSTPATVGDDCRLHGNLRAESIVVGERNDVFGSLRARENVRVSDGTTIHGDVTSRSGTVTIEAGAHVRGDVAAGDLIVHEGAEVDGTLRARGEMKLVQSIPEEAASSGNESTAAAVDNGADESGADRSGVDESGAEKNGGAEEDETSEDGTDEPTPEDGGGQTGGTEPAPTEPAGSPAESGSPTEPTYASEPAETTATAEPAESGASTESGDDADEPDVTATAGARHTEPASVIDDAAAALGANGPGDSAAGDSSKTDHTDADHADVNRTDVNRTDSNDTDTTDDGPLDGEAQNADDDDDTEEADEVWDGWPDHSEADLTADAASDRLSDTSGSLSSVIEEAEERSGRSESSEPGEEAPESRDDADET